MSVLALLANENKTYKFLGSSDTKHAPILCVHTEDNADFKFQKHGIYPDNTKVVEYAKSKKGVIFMIDENEMSQINYNRIVQFAKQIPSLPKLLIIDPDGIRSDLKILTSTCDTITKNIPNFKYHIPNTEFSDNDKTNYNWFLTKIRETVQISKDHKDHSDLDIYKMFVNKTLPMELWNHYGRLRVVTSIAKT
jgi:hypothetical protein